MGFLRFCRLKMPDIVLPVSNIPHESCRIYAVRGYRWLSCAESPHLVDTDNVLSFIACIILVSASVSVEAAPKDTN